MPHSLEIDILNAACKTPVKITSIERKLRSMAKQEIYLTIRGFYGDTIDSIIFKRIGMPIIRESLESHNPKIDAVKRQRLSLFIGYILGADLVGLQALTAEFDKICQTHPQDLTFLLTEAIRMNASVAILSFLIDRGADCNGLGASGRCPIHLAVQKNNLETIALLHQRGALLTTTDDAKYKSLLHNALANKHFPLMHTLVNDYRCDPNRLDYDGNSLLHTAILNGDRSQANLALKLGNNPTRKNIHGETPLEVAISGTKGFDILNSMFTPNKQQIRASRNLIASDVRQAIAERNRIRRILQNIEHIQDGCLQLPSHDISDTDIPLLITALRRAAFIHTINLSHNSLTQAGIDNLMTYLVNESWVVSLNLNGCAIPGHKLLEYCQLLHPNERLRRLLTTYNTEEPLAAIVTMLIDKGAQLTEIADEGWYLWHCAAYRGHLNVINELLARQINIGNAIEDDDKRTCIHLAAEQQYIAMLNTLLASGLFFIDDKNAAKKSGLMISLDNQALAGMELFLSHGANANEVFSQQTLLDRAIDSFPDSIPLLVSHGAKLTDKARQILATPAASENPAYHALHICRQKELALCDAARQNQLESVKKLVQEGIDIRCVDANEQSPFQLAMNNKHWEIATFLIYVDASLLKSFRILTAEEESHLNQYFFAYQTRDDDALIYYLRSKTTHCAIKKVENTHRIIDIYRDLYGKNGDIYVQFTRSLLQVIEHLPNLSIVYDPAAADTKRANILSEEGTRGSFSRMTCSLMKMQKTPTRKNLPASEKPLYILTPNGFYFRGKPSEDPQKIVDKTASELLEKLAALFLEDTAINLSMAQLQQIAGITGHSFPLSHTIYIAGRPAETYARVRGTIIHEICHAVCYFLWKNECEPFTAGSAEELSFNTIYETICAEFSDKKTRRNLDLIIQEVFDYPPVKHKRELIVRIPQIIATHGIDYTMTLCQKSAGFRLLFDYYRNYVLGQAQNYLSSLQQSDIPMRPISAENELNSVCKNMTRTAPSVLLLQQAAVSIQAAYRGFLQRQTLSYLAAAEKCCTILINLLNGLGTQTIVAPVKNHLAEKSFFIGDERHTLFSRYKMSKDLFESFKLQSEQSIAIITQLK